MTAFRAVVLVLLAVPGSAAAESIVVEPGDDLAAAFRQLEPGDELAFGAGDFTLDTELDIAVDGTENGRITIRGSDSTVIEAPSRDVTMRLSGTYFTIQDLEIHGPGTALALNGEEIIVRNSSFIGATTGIDCEDCVGVAISGCEFRALTGEDGAAIRSTSFANGSVEDNYVHDGMGHGIMLTGRTVNTSVADNIVESFAGNGIEVEFPATLAGGQSNNVIGNFVSEVGGHGIISHGGVLMTTNIVTGFGGDGMQSTIGETMSTLDVLITHNTVVGETTCFRATAWSLSVSANAVANNAFYCPDDIAFIFDDGVGMNTIVTGNVYVGTADFPGESTVGNGLGDFLDASANDFYPADDSPLVNAGVADYLTNIDFNNVQRDGVPDAGAYERIGNTNPGGAPGGGFKGETGGSPGADMGGSGGGADGGTSGGSVGGGGATGFPERDGCAGCSSAGSGAAIFPFFAMFALLWVRRRRG